MEKKKSSKIIVLKTEVANKSNKDYEFYYPVYINKDVYNETLKYAFIEGVAISSLVNSLLAGYVKSRSKKNTSRRRKYVYKKKSK